MQCCEQQSLVDTKLMFCCRRRQSDLVVVGRGGFRAVEVYGRDFVREGVLQFESYTVLAIHGLGS